MARVTLYIDGQALRAPLGEPVLWAALSAGIDIPHLCARKDRPLPFGGCRLCYVEVEGRPRPVTSCTLPAAEGLIIHTRTAAVDRLVASAFALLMSHHNLECRRCVANHDCRLQDIARARRLKLKPKVLPRLGHHGEVDESHQTLRLDRSKCVLCGQCIWVCQQRGQGTLDFAHRGLAMEVSTFGDRPLGHSSCDGCEACAHACPTGALRPKSTGEQGRKDPKVLARPGPE